MEFGGQRPGDIARTCHAHPTPSRSGQGSPLGVEKREPFTCRKIGSIGSSGSGNKLEPGLAFFGAGAGKQAGSSRSDRHTHRRVRRNGLEISVQREQSEGQDGADSNKVP